MINDHIPAKLYDVAKSVGLHIEYRRIAYKRGWPEISAKPYGLYYADGSHLASFKSVANMERNLRARAGC